MCSSHRAIAGSNCCDFKRGAHDVENPLLLICQSYLRINQEGGITACLLPSRGRAACKKKKDASKAGNKLLGLNRELQCRVQAVIMLENEK